MKLTRALVKEFEATQREHGTATALFNLLWQKAAADLNDLEVVRIRTSTRPARPRARRTAA